MENECLQLKMQTMKKCILIIATLIFFVAGLSAQSKLVTSLNGTWECFEAKDAGGAIEFINAHTIVLSFKGEKKLSLIFQSTQPAILFGLILP